MDTACLDVKTAYTGLCPSPTKGERPLAMLRPFANIPLIVIATLGTIERFPLSNHVFRRCLPPSPTNLLFIALSKNPNWPSHIVYQSKGLIGFGFRWVSFSSQMSLYHS